MVGLIRLYWTQISRHCNTLPLEREQASPLTLKRLKEADNEIVESKKTVLLKTVLKTYVEECAIDRLCSKFNRMVRMLGDALNTLSSQHCR